MRYYHTLAGALLISTVVFSQTNYSQETLEKIKQVENGLAGRVKVNGKTYNILERMAFYNVKGLSIAVLQNYKLVWAKGYGWADENEKKPVTEKTMFHAASVTKSINGMGILKLAQEQKIDLSADINKYLSSWKFPYDSVFKGKKITTLNLLSHTAGLSNSAPQYFIGDAVPTLIQDLNGTAPSKAPPVHSIMEPALRSEYSNPGIAITQILVTDITKKSYEQYISETILNPLEMNNSFYSEKSLNAHKLFLATGYVEGNEIKGKRVIVPMSSAGGLWTTPSDLCKFISELQLEYKGTSSKILSQEMAKKMLTPYIDKSAAPGVFIMEKNNSKYFTHSGSVMGFNSCYFGSLEGGNGVAVMVNSGNGSALIGEVINGVAEVYEWKDFYNPVIKNEITISESVLKKYEGIYLFENLYAIILKKPDGYYYLSDGVYSKMHFSSEKDFFNVEFLTEKTMLTDASGNATGFLRKVNGKDFPTAVKIKNADTLNRPGFWINTIAWYLLENKQYDNAINFLKRGMALSPNDINAIGNLGHCYLFNNDYEKAIKLYKEFIAKASNSSQKEMIGSDFVIFKNKGFDKSVMDKALSELKLEIPKAYYTE